MGDPWGADLLNTIRGLDFDPLALTQKDLLTDSFWASRCTAFNIQADLDGSTVLAARRVGDALTAALPGQRLVPSAALHVSVLNLIHARSVEPDPAKEATWKRNRSRWVTAVQEVAADTEPFAIAFSHVVPTPSGIVIASAECIEMLTLRRRLAAALGIQARPAELTHVTVMRFGPQPPDICLVRNALERFDIEIICRIDELRLVRELVYPSLRRRTLGRFDLSRSRRYGSTIR